MVEEGSVEEGFTVAGNCRDICEMKVRVNSKHLYSKISSMRKHDQAYMCILTLK